MSEVLRAFPDDPSDVTEDTVPVPGALLRYRLAGSPAATRVVLIENGWSASFPYAVWLEEALCAHARVLSYDRAGIGDSRSLAPVTPAGLTQQLGGLLSHLGIDEPVVIAGHSYGGLIAALHAAQAPARVRAIVQIDPTPEFAHPLVDPSLRQLPALGRLMQLCALLGIDAPIFFHAGRELPPAVYARIRRTRSWLARSLGGSVAEARLLDAIRTVVASSPAAQRCPRLVMSSDPPTQPASWLRRRLVNESKAQRYWDAVRGLHQHQAALDGASRWMSIRDNHISMVTRRSTAHRVAASIVDFMRLQENP